MKGKTKLSESIISLHNIFILQRWANKKNAIWWRHITCRTDGGYHKKWRINERNSWKTDGPVP